MSCLTVIAHASTQTNTRLGGILSPSQAIVRLQPGDLALGRLDVLGSLDGVERGMWVLDLLEQRGVCVLNSRASLALSHDKLATAEVLTLAGIPHPATTHVAPWREVGECRTPVVLKPRFGSWGRDVMLCATREDLSDAIARSRSRVWFNATGGVLQEFVPPLGFDLRVIVAAGHVVGAVSRRAPEGEWRTNLAFGAIRVPTDPPQEARRLAIAAAAAVGGDLVGVDLLPLTDGHWVVLEVNGAVDFTEEYSFSESVFDAARAALSGARAVRFDALEVLTPA